jgi:hypothetical protein
MNFATSRPQKKEKDIPVRGRPLHSRACAFGAFIGLRGRKCIKKNRIWLGLRFNDYRSLNLNMILKIEFYKTKMAYGLIKNIKGYHIHFWSSSNSSIEKSYDAPVIVAGGLPNLVMLSE